MKRGTDTDNVGRLKFAFWLNLVFAGLEIFGGLWTNSLAITSDAVHDFGDALSLGLSWYLERYSTKESNRRFTYGYRRLSLVGALINTIVVVAGSLIVLSQAIPRLADPQATRTIGMLIFAIVGLVANGVAALRVRGGQTLNVQVVGWHLLEDVLGWAAVLVASIILLFWDVPILDPILAILITIYVLFNVLRNLRKTFALFLQGVPKDVSLSEVERRLRSIEGVHSVHHTHIWSLDGEHHVLTSHLVIDADSTVDDIGKVRMELKELTQGLAIEHTTFEIERGSQDRRMDEA
jgi:cobalt-zinc-cadmium efflux system protein